MMAALSVLLLGNHFLLKAYLMLVLSKTVLKETKSIILFDCNFVSSVADSCSPLNLVLIYVDKDGWHAILLEFDSLLWIGNIYAPFKLFSMWLCLLGDICSSYFFWVSVVHWHWHSTDWSLLKSAVSRPKSRQILDAAQQTHDIEH